MATLVANQIFGKIETLSVENGLTVCLKSFLSDTFLKLSLS